MRYFRLLIKIFIFFVIFQVSLWAKEINIDADKMEVIEDDGLAIFTGKVFARTKDLKLWADKLYVYYAKSSEGKREIQRIIALGKVRIEKGNWKAVAGRATYLKTLEKLTLEEDPKVWHNDNLVEGDLVNIYFNEDRSEVISKDGGRVRVRLYEK